ncbi:YciI family protein [Psychrobacter sp. I-STPA6b]|uniref:YciI family protein n=1 Tax=Psychrobacter sp. I-STPA6b TaxID=2585718 RepID=UPI001D0C9976|nr:YciI family protein [Psychrobacter sp. I-STPA6b]
MSLFVIIGHDVAESAERRQQTRPAHIARLQDLQAQGRLIIAGPTPITHGQPQMSGSVVIADFDNLESAQAWVNDEPYLQAGVYSHVDVKPFIQALPTPQDNTES